jgi:hypothetical protein
VGVKILGRQGQTWDWILHFYYSDIGIQVMSYRVTLLLMVAGGQ